MDQFMTTFLGGYRKDLVDERLKELVGQIEQLRREAKAAGEREDQLPEELRRRRADLIMEQQAPIAFAWAQGCVGRELEVLVEGREDGRYCGRSYMDAPDIDTKVYFTAKKSCRPGEFCRVRVTGAEGYDLLGEEAL